MAEMPPEDEAPRIENLSDPEWYINRELSWLQFNKRVLDEAFNTDNPLLERVKFLAIFASNLDEFFMIRVSGLRHMVDSGSSRVSADGMTAGEQLAAIRQSLAPDLERQQYCWRDILLPELHKNGIETLGWDELSDTQRGQMVAYFEQELYPALTPLAFDPGHPFPHISNLSLNLAVVIDGSAHGERFARVKIPNSFPRLLQLPSDDEEEIRFASLGLPQTSTQFVWIEDLITANLDMLFPGLEIKSAHLFRITRDADIEIEEDEAADLLTAIEEGIGMRKFGSVIRMQVDANMPNRIRDILMSNLGLDPYLVYTVEGPIGMVSLWDVFRVDRPDLKYDPYQASTPPVLTTEENIFSVIKRQNVLLYHPYDSFNPVVEFIRDAAHDPQVLAIKQTLYRVDHKSPIINALMEARENEKQVAVLVELKARFDEENNITWARELERAGVHVVYGLVGLKVHSKISLVVRREDDGSIQRYAHLSTGNYNSITARIYTDTGFFTSDPAIGADLTDLFNALTGYSRRETYRKLLVAPGTMRDELLSRIDREIENHREYGNGYIAFKMNALVDPKCIKALYQASQEGVRIDLQVRGICCLRPGIPGLSDTISVSSVVGRFLEHARIYSFHNNGNPEVLLGSADLMPRNLDRRVEQLFPVEPEAIRDALLNQVLNVHLRDTKKAHRLLSDGTYERILPEPGVMPFDSQQWMIDHQGAWYVDG